MMWINWFHVDLLAWPIQWGTIITNHVQIYRMRTEQEPHVFQYWIPIFVVYYSVFRVFWGYTCSRAPLATSIKIVRYNAFIIRIWILIMLLLLAFLSSPKYLIYCSDEEEKLWVWSYQDTDMFMDLEEEVCSYLIHYKDFGEGYEIFSAFPYV